MNDEIVERILNEETEADVGSGTSIDETSSLAESLIALLIGMLVLYLGNTVLLWVWLPGMFEMVNLDVLWIAVWGVMFLGGAVVAVALSAYIVPRFGLLALPIGLGLAVVDVYVVLPRAVLFVAEEFVQPMQLAAYPDVLSGLLALVGIGAVVGPITLLAAGFMLHGVSAGFPKGGEQEEPDR